MASGLQWHTAPGKWNLQPASRHLRCPASFNFTLPLINDNFSQHWWNHVIKQASNWRHHHYHSPRWHHAYISQLYRMKTNPKQNQRKSHGAAQGNVTAVPNCPQNSTQPSWWNKRGINNNYYQLEAGQAMGFVLRVVCRPPALDCSPGCTPSLPTRTQRAMLTSGHTDNPLSRGVKNTTILSSTFPPNAPWTIERTNKQTNKHQTSKQCQGPGGWTLIFWYHIAGFAHTEGNCICPPDYSAQRLAKCRPVGVVQGWADRVSTQLRLRHAIKYTTTPLFCRLKRAGSMWNAAGFVQEWVLAPTDHKCPRLQGIL